MMQVLQPGVSACSDQVRKTELSRKYKSLKQTTAVTKGFLRVVPHNYWCHAIDGSKEENGNAVSRAMTLQ